MGVGEYAIRIKKKWVDHKEFIVNEHKSQNSAVIGFDQKFRYFADQEIFIVSVRLCILREKNGFDFKGILL